MIERIVDLPYQYIPRSYQCPLWKANIVDNVKRSYVVAHRRWGKDITTFNITIIKAFERVGTYIYLYPELKQARDCIWKGLEFDGKRFLDHFPPEIIKPNGINNSDMRISLINGSEIILRGSDRYNSLRSGNAVGVILSEHAFQHPLGWETISPVLAENGGWAIFITTFNGRNHAYEMYEFAKNEKSWFCDLQTIETTLRPDGTALITKEFIDAERRRGKDEAEIQQEYYCNPNAQVKGAIFSEYLNKAYSDKRVYDFHIDTSLPVFTFSDIGWEDPTAIWWAQFPPGGIRIINYYENNQKDIPHYWSKLCEFRDKYSIHYDKHFVPHDGENKTIISGGKSMKMIAKELGWAVTVVPSAGKMSSIENARGILPICEFHETNCRIGLLALADHHFPWNRDSRMFGSEPVHNWSSHGSDAFKNLANAYKNGMLGSRLANTGGQMGSLYRGGEFNE